MTSTALAERVKTFEKKISAPEAHDRLKTYLGGDDALVEKFKQVAVRAVAENPSIAGSDINALTVACSHAAQDGLMPDGREGAFVMYKNKVQWQPMVGGLRKILAQLGFSIRAEVVCSNDTHWDWEEGDNPRIEHVPAPLGTDRGDIRGAYAIATGPDGQQYRAVLDIQKINKVKAISRAKNGPWKTWFDEMAKKTAIKALVKTLPLDSSREGMERLYALVKRDNDREFNLKTGDPGTSEANSIQDKVRKLHPEPRNKPEPIDPEPAPDPEVIEGELVTPEDPF